MIDLTDSFHILVCGYASPKSRRSLWKSHAQASPELSWVRISAGWGMVMCISKMIPWRLPGMVWPGRCWAEVQWEMEHFPAWHNLILSLSQLWLCPYSNSQPSVTHPRPLSIAPRSFLINSCTLLMSAKAVPSPGCQTRSPSCNPLWLLSTDISGQEENQFPAAISRDMHFLSLELRTSCQLSSNWNRSSCAWLLPHRKQEQEWSPPISAQEKTESVSYSLETLVPKFK